MRRTFLVAAALGLALSLDVGLLAAGVGPGPVDLRFRPQGRPLDFSCQETTIQVELHRKGSPITHRYDFEKRLRRTVRLDAAGRLAVRVEVVALKGLMDGRPLRNLPAAPPHDALVTPQGLSIEPGGREVASVLSLVLPKNPLPPPVSVLGVKSLDATTWTQVCGPTTDLPIQLTTYYRVAQIDTVLGRECVVIKTSAQGQAPAFQNKVGLEVWGRGQVAFDPATGTVVDSMCELRVSQVFLPRFKEPLRIHTETKSRIRLIP